METTRILKFITAAVEGELHGSELKVFIIICRAFSKACILREIQQGRLDLDHSLVGNGQLDDFALDSIADLFARDELGDLIHFKRFFAPQLNNLTNSPERVIPILRKLIASRVHQSLVALFSRVDQGGWKIWRNLSLVATRHSAVHEFSYLGQVFLYYATESGQLRIPDDLNPQASAPPDQVLSEQLRAHMQSSYGLPQGIAAILQDLRTQFVYQHFLARGQLFQILKERLNINYIDVEEIDALSTPVSRSASLDTDIRAHIPLDRFIEYIQKTLQERYVDKGKIDVQLKHSYITILQLYFTDLLADGFVERLPEYLALSGASSLSDKDWLLHRGRLEYMIKLGRDHIRELLEQANFSRNSEMQVYS